MVCSVDFSVDFGSKLIQVQCPNCQQVYNILDKDLNEGMVDCWNYGCNARYLQHFHVMSTPKFIREALFRCRGDKIDTSKLKEIDW